MDSKLDKIEGKIDRLDERLDSIDVTLGKQNVSLEYHVHRTNLAEESIALLRSEIKPLSQHVTVINGIAKVISVVAALAALYTFFRKL